MLRRAVASGLACALFTGCGLVWSHSRIESSVQLEPGARTTLRVRAVPPAAVTLVLTGQGLGAMRFTAHTPDGAPMANGALGCGDTASCSSSEGELVVDFTAPAAGATVGYVARSREGLAIELVPRQP